MYIHNISKYKQILQDDVDFYIDKSSILITQKRRIFSAFSSISILNINDEQLPISTNG